VIIQLFFYSIYLSVSNIVSGEHHLVRKHQERGVIII